MLRLSRAQLREVDRISIHEYGLPGIVLMENAARSAAEIIDFHHRGDGVDGTTATIVCGGGNNGGDGFAIARLLHNDGWHVAVIALKPIDQLTADAAIMAKVVRKMSQIHITSDLSNIDQTPGLLIDAITGTGLTRPLEGVMADAVRSMNAAGRPIIAIDVPSGLDCDTGEPLGTACIRATRTVTFVADKVGFENARTEDFTGIITIGGIGCPREILAQLSNL